MFASAGMLIPEGAMSWVVQAKDKNDIKEHHGGFVNGKRKYQRRFIGGLVGERRLEGGEKWMGCGRTRTKAKSRNGEKKKMGQASV